MSVLQQINAHRYFPIRNEVHGLDPMTVQTIRPDLYSHFGTIHVNNQHLSRASTVIEHASARYALVYWPHVVKKIAGGDWTVSDVSLQSVIETDVGLLSQVSPMHYRSGDCVVQFNGHRYMVPRELMFYDGESLCTIIMDLVIVCSTHDGAHWTGSNVNSHPLGMRPHYAALLGKRIRDLRRDIRTAVHDKRRAMIMQIARRIYRMLGVRKHIPDGTIDNLLISNEWLHRTVTTPYPHTDVVNRIIDRIETELFGRVHTVFRQELVNNLRSVPFVRLLTGVHIEFCKTIGTMTFEPISTGDRLTVPVSVGKSVKMFSALGSPWFVGSYQVMLVQVTHLIKRTMASPGAAPVLPLRTAAIPQRLIDQVAHLTTLHTARCDGDLVHIVHGRRTFQYPRRWLQHLTETDAIDDVNIAVSDARYVYSPDGTMLSWQFVDIGSDLTTVLGSEDVQVVDTDQLVRLSAPVTVAPSTTAVTDDASARLTQLPIAVALDYKLDDIACFGHRCGWPYVIDAVVRHNKPDTKPIVLIDLIEKTFAWSHIDDSNITGMKDIHYDGVGYHVHYKDLKMVNRNGWIVTVARIKPDVIVEWDCEWKPSKDARTDAEYEQLAPLRNRQINEPWIGMWHNPHNMPEWFDYVNSPQVLMTYPNFRESLKHCVGIIVLSEYFASWVREHVPGIPVSVLFHPTAIPPPDACFSMTKFMTNTNKRIVQIGYWLRDMCAIGRLHAPGYRKIWLYGGTRAFFCIEEEAKQHSAHNCECSDMDDVETLRLSDADYDDTLAANIMFLNLYDSSANNAVIECIARRTPLLVNRHPAVVEYLGPAYPFYYSDLDEAARLLQDVNRIRETHAYLCSTAEVQDRIRLSRFMNDLATCTVVTGAADRIARDALSQGAR